SRHGCRSAGTSVASASRARAAESVVKENSSAGHSSPVCAGGTLSCAPSTTWKLVPPKPNALTPAIRSAGGAAHGCAADWNTNGLVEGSHAGFGEERCSVGGLTPVCSASAVL